MDYNKNAVCVLASINVDMVVSVDHFPKPGETILGKEYQKFFGGKGANQAVCAKRMGANVHVIGKVGEDSLGKEYLANFKQEQIETEDILCVKEKATGMAFINVDSEGQNNIIVVPGANEALSTDDVERVRGKLEKSKTALSQFEVSVTVTQRFFELAKKEKCITIFNPAPAKEIPAEMFAYIDILIPNEGELELLTNTKITNLEEAKKAADIMINKGIPYVLVTLGEKGSLLVSKKEECCIPSQKVLAVDTTAAGDSFVGALAAKLAQEEELSMETIKKSALFATQIAAITVQRKGAQASLPHLRELSVEL